MQAVTSEVVDIFDQKVMLISQAEVTSLNPTSFACNLGEMLLMMLR